MTLGSWPKRLAMLLGHGAGELAVFGVGPVELLAVAVLVALAVFLDAEGFGILGGEPGGRRGGGGAEDDGDVVRSAARMAWSSQSRS